jgi:hypothetical protein
MNQARIRTTTTNFVLRFLDVAVAFLLRNLWVWLHYRVLSRRRRGGRVIALRRLPFRRMLLWLEQVAIMIYQLNEAAMTERPLPAKLAS